MIYLWERSQISHAFPSDNGNMKTIVSTEQRWIKARVIESEYSQRNLISATLSSLKSARTLLRLNSQLHFKCPTAKRVSH